jgi:hypothetical protein
MFERPISFQHGDGTTSAGRVDCYLRGHFVCESKRLKSGLAAEAQGGATTKAFDDAMLKAREQAERYTRALPAAEGRPPFVVVADVGHVIELYAEFTRSGGTYTPFPDPTRHRIKLEALADPAVRTRLQALWLDPLSLDPSRASAKATRAVAAELAELAKRFEADGHPSQTVAAFLTRSLFSMFAEDVGLLPKVGAEEVGGFTHLLRSYRERPAVLVQQLKVLWQGMDMGGFNPLMEGDLRRFNGKLFKGAAEPDYVLPLTTEQVDGLLRAASANWKEVEPAIFGTLLERALSSTERQRWARTTHRAPMWNAWCCPPWCNPCAPTGPMHRPPPCCWRAKHKRWKPTRRSCKAAPRTPPTTLSCAPGTTALWPNTRAGCATPGRPRGRRSCASTTSCAPPACCTRPAAAATSCT